MSLPLTIDIAFSLSGALSDHRELSLLCHDCLLHNGIPCLTAPFLPCSSDEELDLVLFVLAATPQWVDSSVEVQANALIMLFDAAQQKFAKAGPADGHFNKWWNVECAQAKINYNNYPCHHTCLAFQAVCKAAKKAYFAGKLRDMIKHCKLWLGTHWIKDCPIPKVPQICSSLGNTINELHPMFEVFQQQSQPNLDSCINLSLPFLNTLPSKPVRPFAPFSVAELNDALATCSSSSAPGPSHM